MPQFSATGAAAGRSSAVVAARERTPGTPSRRDRPRESSALQDPDLKDFRLGECLGKGAFGSVYKAFNWGTGEAVAVKQIRLADLPKSELRMIETEIDLLKNLHHDNIVKYIGFVKSVDCLNIILEYCENGSLHSIIKAYGKFPENLVGVYMTQVLQGLQYLHDQGVIHRDIKGANILTTKGGIVKLADFGVSTKGAQDKEAQVVGTPYWMAPEIIQLSGASSASDIWSVGSTVIELLEGKPPYGNLAAMPALFAIVSDDHPPLPEGISAACRDFLMQCFQKDPNLRVSARKLLRHPWIFSCRRADAQISKKPANFSQTVEEVKQWNQALEESETSMRASTGSDNAGPPTRLTEGTPAKAPSSLVKPKSAPRALGIPEVANDDNWDDDFASAISPTALHLKTQDNFGGVFSSDKLKAFASMTEQRHDGNSYDDDFEGELQTIKAPSQFSDPEIEEETIRPFPRRAAERLPPPFLQQAPSLLSSAPVLEPPVSRRGHQRSKSSVPLMGGGTPGGYGRARSPPKPSFGSIKFELPPRPDQVYREQSVEDYSDLFLDNDDYDFDRHVKQAVKKSRQAEAPQLFHPSDLTSLPRSAQPQDSGSLRKKTNTRPSVLPDRPMRRTRSSIEIQKFAEADDEDFSDIFGPATSSIAELREESIIESEGDLMLASKMSTNSWLGDDDDEDDPFASMDPGWDEMDLDANIARDKHARLAQKVEELVNAFKTSEGEDVLDELSKDLLGLLWENGDVKNLIISAHGLLPILEILERCTLKSRQSMILQLLKVVNAIILDDVDVQENLCFVGGIPIVTKFAARQYSNEIRLEAAAFVRQMYQTSTLTLQMFVSAGGLNVLVEFLDEDYDMSRDLVLIGVNGIWNVFELQGPTPKNDFCRIFSRSKILYPLALVLHRVLDEEDSMDELTELIEGRIVNIFYLFSQAENHVKEMVADRQVLKSVLKDLRRMTPIHQVTMLKFIKNLSMLSTTILALHSADAIDCLIDLLSLALRKSKSHFREICNQVLNTLFNLCRLNKERQEDAAVGGIIPLLLSIMQTDRPPKEFALPILCDMAHSGSKGRRYLWQNKGLDFYVSLLTDQYWQVTALDAIYIWLQEETAKVETHLLHHGNFTAAIISCFNTNRINAFDANILEPLLRVLRHSPELAATLARPEMFAGISQRLGHKKPAVRLDLLRVVRNIMEACEMPMQGGGDGLRTLNNSQVRSLMESIQSLAETDSAVLVREQAKKLLTSATLVQSSSPRRQFETLYTGNNASSVGLNSPASTASMTSISSRRGNRRNTSFTPPALQTSYSVPQTPSHRSRPSTATSSSYIEVAAPSPRRNNASPRRLNVLEREHTYPRFDGGNIYRPHSRDGPTGIPRRVSGDSATSATSVNLKTGAASRLPTVRSGTPGSTSSTNTRTPTVVRRESNASNASNKENFSSSFTRPSYMSSSRENSLGSSTGIGGEPPQRRRIRQGVTREMLDREREAAIRAEGGGQEQQQIIAAAGKRRRQPVPSVDLNWP